MQWSWKREAPQLLLMAAIVLSSVIAWRFVEEPVPVHWNARGEVDRYGSKLEALGLLPALSVGLYLLLLFIPRIDPAKANYPSFAGAYALIRLGTLGVIAVIQAGLLLAALGRGDVMGWLAPTTVGVLLLIFGNVMGKLRPNYFAGIRTPWTLASVRSWEATHRVGGRGMMIGGVLFILMAIVRQTWFVIGGLVVIGLGLIWILLYSYLVWRRDPDPVPATGTRPSDTSED